MSGFSREMADLTLQWRLPTAMPRPRAISSTGSGEKGGRVAIYVGRNADTVTT
jgi:hypothetical protein